MNRAKRLMLAAATVVCAFAIGCANTEEGAKKDIANADDSLRKGEGARVAKNVVAAVEVTPKVKSAINADKSLNATGNVINVNSADGVVHLTGHVKSNDLKIQAAKVAQKALDDNHSTDKLSNELKISPG